MKAADDAFRDLSYLVETPGPHFSHRLSRELTLRAGSRSLVRNADKDCMPCFFRALSSEPYAAGATAFMDASRIQKMATIIIKVRSANRGGGVVPGTGSAAVCMSSFIGFRISRIHR
jgi:hypothetical protein